MRRVRGGVMIVAVLVPVTGSLTHAAEASSQRSSNIALRKRLHVNTLITEPGTVEVEFGSLYSFFSDNLSLPTLIKYTPEGKRVLWGRTEYSVGFDSAFSSIVPGGRNTQFSDRVTFSANAVIFDGAKLDIALAPQATFFLRDEAGARIGATAIARYDWGRNTAGMSVSWSAASVSSATNPAGILDVGLGFGRRLRASGFASHFTPHTNVIYEKSTGVERTISMFEGVEYQITDKVAVDFSAQHLNFAGGLVDHGMVVGLTVNLGKLRHEKAQGTLFLR